MRIQEKAQNFTAADEVRALGIYPYFRPIESDQDTEVIIEGKRVLMMGSNNYLGLTNHPEVKKAAIEAINRYGTGCAGSRFLNGTLRIHLQLEDELAEFIGKEATLLFSTGFQVNQGVISSLVGRDGAVIIDRADHASIIDGCRLSFGKTLKYEHNDMEALDKTLSNLNGTNGLIVSDGVFSMEGDIADLPGIVELAEKYECDIMVDDAHAIGVIGQGGRGTAAHFDLEDRVQLIMGTFSKSLASIGGFIAGDRSTIDFLKHQSRALIFSASPPPASVASARAALRIMKEEPERLERLWDNTRRLWAQLKAINVDIGKSQTPIVPVMIGDDLKTFRVCQRLQEEGIFVNPVVSPAVPLGESLIRLSIMSTHTFEQIDRAVETIDKVLDEFEVERGKKVFDG
ncbi:MAG: aminotransferase class I/II-fold pyridoxal phosphate-dependent enzyme [Candidatus Hatepunaea meridiana]|nr:aminotransferase class I/II-fold pyridoxal phosphate-dependent enzyme [Candidatus Hatepunaea meridiana]